MKRIFLIVCLFLLFTSGFSQKFEFGINGIIGYTLVDVESVVEEELTDWDQLSYGGYVIGLYHLKPALSLGLDAGYHRLYYWEYVAYWGYNWRDEATIHFGPILELRKTGLYAQAGANVRIFTDGSGTVPGVMVGGGYQIRLSQSFAIPIGVRADVVFGTETPVAFDLSIGLRYRTK